ncbi:TonB-dependent receptor [Colwellia sp. MB02u-18]|uniref:TonB-dependent receptor n=1 Tax=unclassified Colwellia TaxID=196834 RepID=UPI0015F359A0|nr:MULTISPECIES: TonB-dependent receptor [unclassified Colwellia]MBA6224193.1 TonB-dependent receptor [Colwellia sp. MB3u-45]MBA6268323.1 TonB-dependent receptor [Colwellia sp. MB3u-43]MBA6322725.1 TonB-dependent receptor [Colwellia sp. MB02u-19]MBA6323525.1 TonB-dependent receptor [Colwellia sp. MB02u-18]MBA6332868.1 TonB-dependent receptor [Colwellia sp. MB02u-12]
MSIAVSSAILSTQVLSQSLNTIENEQEIEEITVTGIRGALVRAQAIKMDSTSIVEAISSEDIGKLPDSSIAESLARLSGLSGERVGGRTSGISVRGFKEDFTGTSLNGRELIGIGDNRGVEYDLYPSEIMTGATVYKTSDASLMVQGIGGTVDLQSVRPLSSVETLTFNGNYEVSGRDSDNPEFTNKGKRFSLSFVEKFADDTIGLAVALASTESPNNQRKYGVWGYAENADGQMLPTGIDSQSISTVLERDTISAVLQYQPTEDINLVLDVLDIDYADSGVLRGFIEPFSSEDVTGTGVSSSGTQVLANPVLRTDPLQKNGELRVYGLNLEYNVDDMWSVELDVAHSKSKKRDARAESYAGLARSGALDSSQLGSREFVMGADGIMFTDSEGLDAFSNPDALQLTGPQTWGGGLANLADQFTTSVTQANGDPYSYFNAQDGFYNYANFNEELTTAKFQVNGMLDGDFFTKILVGINYSDRTKDKENKGLFATATAYPLSTSIPSDYVYGLADLTWAGLGKVVAYDGFAPYKDGTYTLNDAGLLEPDRLGDTYIVEEQVTTLFAKIDFETELSGFFIRGNFGAQYITTDQSSSGFIGVVGSNFTVCDENNDNKIDTDCITEQGDDYSHFLPSVNVSIEVGENQFLRLAANKTISRARIDQMKASGFVKFGQSIDSIAVPNTEAAVDLYGSPWSKFSGNPLLRPLEAHNFDISFENYFEGEGYISIAGFYKDLVNWTRDGNALIDFTNDSTNDGANYFIPGFHDRVIDQDGVYGPADIQYSAGDIATPPDLGYYSYFEDGLTGKVKGIELTANIPMSLIFDGLDGFGISSSGTLIDAKLEDGTKIPGQSDHVYSFTGYYENEGFEVRIAGTNRSEFDTYERGGSNKISTATRQGVTLIDAQVSYDFANSSYSSLQGLRVSLQGTNLTDEDEETIDDNGIVTTRRQFGPAFMVNFNYSFY